MTLSDLAKRFGKITADNSPAIMTAIGVTGTLATAYLTGRASFKAAEVLRDEYDDRINEAGGVNGDWEAPSTQEKVEFTWQLYIPAAGTAAITIAAIIAANRIGTRRAAAMAAAYSISERAFSEYKEKVIEKVGEKKEQGYRDEIAQERVDRNPVVDREVIVASGGDVLCYDEFTGRYFQSDIETLKKAQNDTNYQINNNWYASLSDFYDNIGLKPTSYSDEVGWSSDKLLELRFSYTSATDGRPCLSVGFVAMPVRNYHRMH